MCTVYVIFHDHWNGNVRAQYIPLPNGLGQVKLQVGQADTVKLTGPWTLADKRVGPVKLLCIIMFDISKVRPKSILGPMKAQKFSRCLGKGIWAKIFYYILYKQIVNHFGSWAIKNLGYVEPENVILTFLMQPFMKISTKWNIFNDLFQCSIMQISRTKAVIGPPCLWSLLILLWFTHYRKTSYISRTLVGN